MKLSWFSTVTDENYLFTKSKIYDAYFFKLPPYLPIHTLTGFDLTTHKLQFPQAETIPLDRLPKIVKDICTPALNLLITYLMF
jgi:hypothetical protein